MKSNFTVIQRLIFSVMFLALGACSDDDTNTKATTKQTESSGSVVRTPKVQVLDKSNIEFEDVSGEEFTKQLTAHIKETNGLSWIAFQPTDSDQKRAEQAAVAWIMDNGMKEGWDPEKKRFVSIEVSRSELGCLLMALATTREFMHSETKTNITSAEKLTNMTSLVKLNGIETRSQSNFLTEIVDGTIVERRVIRMEISLPGQPGRAVYSSEKELQTLNTDKTIEGQISHRIDGKEVSKSSACVFIVEPSP